MSIKSLRQRILDFRFLQPFSLREILLDLQESITGGIKYFQAGTNVTFTGGDGKTEETPIIINATGGAGGGIESVTGEGVDNTDPNNPIISQYPVFHFFDDGAILQIDNSGLLFSFAGGAQINFSSNGIAAVLDDNGTYIQQGAIQLQNQGNSVFISTGTQTGNGNITILDLKGVSQNLFTGFRGKTTVNPSSGVITIPHGLGVTPQFVTVDLNDQRSIELREYLVTENSTNITITFENPPAESTVTVYWTASA